MSFATVYPITTATGATGTLSTSAAAGPAVACVRGFWFRNADASITVYVGKDSTVTNAGAYAIDAIAPGERVWFGASSPAIYYFVAASGTPTYRITGE